MIIDFLASWAHLTFLRPGTSLPSYFNN
uniref:Uncharacterized protein n=1 Tax=Anguilla anguilla TaxID=7936 RepID=A0A0E9SSB8_ANGAN